MEELLTKTYLWVKSFHVIFVICWMAGLFYLPRLFVYHHKSEVNSVQSHTFILMERKLLRMIMNPAMILSYIFGIALLFTPGLVDWTSGWLHFKLLFVVFLTFYHHLLARYFKAFQSNLRPQSEKFFRIINEIPLFLLIGIVIMVIVKPF